MERGVQKQIRSKAAAWAVGVAALGLLAIECGQAEAAPYIYHSTSFAPMNQTSPYSWGGVTFDWQRLETLGDTGIGGTANFNGRNSSGQPETMSASYNATTSVGRGALRNSAGLAVSNPFFNTTYNSPMISMGAPYNPNGLPGGFSVSSSATFGDFYQVSGAAGLSHVVIKFGVAGEVRGHGEFDARISFGATPDSLSTRILGYHLGADVTQPFPGKDVIFDDVVNSAPIALTDGQFYLQMGLYSTVFPQMADGFEGDYLQGLSAGDFSFLSFTGFNEAGEEVALYSVTGSDGYVYWSQVPEPMSLGLVGVGLGALGVFGRRRRTKIGAAAL